MPKNKSKKQKKVERTRMADEQAEKFFLKYAKDREIKPADRAKYAMRYAGRRLAALARDQKKHAA